MLGAQSYAKITMGRGGVGGGGRASRRSGSSAAITSKLTLPWMTSTSSLGLFGLTTGLTAYVGIFCVYSSKAPRKGETVIITDATSAVGSIAAQLAKTTGATVIGISSNKKSKSYLMNDLELDGAIIYNSNNDIDQETVVEDQLESICPRGVDFVFDNVGGEILDTVLNHIRPKARVVICDAVSQYETSKTTGPSNYLKLVQQGAEMKGFTVFQYTRRIPAAVFFLWWYSLRGKVKMTESIHEGIKSFPLALQTTLRLDDNRNIGKTLVVL